MNYIKKGKIILTWRYSIWKDNIKNNVAKSEILKANKPECINSVTGQKCNIE